VRHPFYWFTCRPVREKGRTVLTFVENSESVLLSRISSIIPPNRAFRLSWHRAAGRVGTFEVHPRFFLESVAAQRNRSCQLSPYAAPAVCDQPPGGLDLPAVDARSPNKAARVAVRILKAWRARFSSLWRRKSIRGLSRPPTWTRSIAVSRRRSHSWKRTLPQG
jgi:hypothetical protein